MKAPLVTLSGPRGRGYWPDALAPDDHERVTQHLAGCRACTVHLDQVRATITVVRRSVATPPPTIEEVDGLARLLRSHRPG